MPPFLLKIAKFMAQRPQDRTIYLFHILSGLVIMALLWFSQDRYVLDIPFIGVQSPSITTNIRYGLLAIGLLPLLKGLIPFCLVKHKTLRITQAILGLMLILIGGPIMDPIVTTTTPSNTKAESGFQIDIGETTTQTSHPGIWLIFLGVLWIFIGLTGKGTTEKCLRYREVVKKIRV